MKVSAWSGIDVDVDVDECLQLKLVPVLVLVLVPGQVYTSAESVSNHDKTRK